MRMSNDPFARLQGADPAGPDPDLSALAARVIADASAPPTEADASGDASAGITRARRPWLLPVAAGVTAIALAGSAAVGYSAGRDGATIVASPPIAVEALAPEGQAAASTMGDSQPMTVDSGAAAKSMLATPTVWLAAGSVPDAPSVGTGYRIVRGDIDPRALTRQLAQEFGLEGAESDQPGGWKVGSVDGSGPTLWLNDDAALSWSFSDPQQVDGSTPLDVGQATSVARGFLRSIGVPVREVEWQAMQVGAVTTVTAWHRVGGVRTQLQWTVSVAPDESIVGASGFAAAFEPIPGYELVGAATAIDRISEPGWLALAPTAIAPGQDLPVEAPSVAGIAPLMNGRPTLNVPVSSVTLTGSSIGLAIYAQPDGSMFALPSYLLSDSSGATWSLIAVADRYVRLSVPTLTDPADLVAR